MIAENTISASKRDELNRLIQAADDELGFFSGIPVCLFWPAFFSVVYEAGEEANLRSFSKSLLQLNWSDFNQQTRLLLIRGEKVIGTKPGKTLDRCIRLSEETTKRLLRIRNPSNKLIFPSGLTQTSFYFRTLHVRKRAGLTRVSKRTKGTPEPISKKTEQVIKPVSPPPKGEDLYEMFLIHYRPRRLRGTSKQNTRLFKISIDCYANFLGRPPTTGDLDDDRIQDWLFWFTEQGRSPYTANCYRSKIVALWTFLAKRKVIDTFPTVEKLKEPRRIPRAWTPDQLSKLFRACQEQTGKIGNAPASLWWQALHAVI